MHITNLKEILAKNPKSLLFAQFADSLRLSSLGVSEKLDEALLVADKGLEANPDFLPGRLVKGRILLEKGDLQGAQIEFEEVANRDPFCLVAHKSLLEIAEQTEQPLQTDIYAKILSAFEPETEIKVKAIKETSKKEFGEPELMPFVKSDKTADKTESTSVSAALDNLLDEENSNDSDISALLLKAVDRVLSNTTPTASLPLDLLPPDFEDEPNLMPYVPPQETAAELPPAAIDEAPAAPSSGDAPLPAIEPLAAAPAAPNLDDLINEQLASKVEDVPDITNDLNALLASDTAPNLEPTSYESAPKAEETPSETASLDALLAFASTPEPEPAAEPAAELPAAPNLDDLINEQLASKVEDVPDVTEDLNALLASASEAEPEPELMPYVPSAPPAAPNLDDLISEQLASKVENVPDVTEDLNALLASASEAEPEPELMPYVPSAPPAAPNLDDLINEQLASKIEDVPDITEDLNALLASAPVPDLEPTSAEVSSIPNLDDLINEQLASKVENVPDVTGDIDALLAEASALAPNLEPTSIPNLDDLINEQLASKVENVPDVTGDIDALLAEASALVPNLDTAAAAEVSDVPDIDAIIKEQLADRGGNAPDLTNDMDALLNELGGENEQNEILAQNPTLTLAELYASQGLMEKAIAVYKELLARDPDNEDLKTKLALTELQL